MRRRQNVGMGQSDLALIVGVLVLGSIFSPGPFLARASDEVTEQVAQPIEHANGIDVCIMTYITMGRLRVPGSQIPLVCAENRVVVRGEAENRNVAFAYGFKSEIAAEHYHTNDLIGDTLKVVLDLSSIADRDTSVGSNKTHLDHAVEATVEAILLSAWIGRYGFSHETRQRTEAKRVRLEVRGSSRYAALGRVYAFEDLGPLPRKFKCD